MALATSIKNAQQIFQKHGFSRSHELRIHDVGEGIPSYVKNELIEDGGRTYIQTASLPKVSISNIEVRYQNFPFNMPGQIEFETEQSWTIRLPSDFLLRNALERWIFATQNPDTNCGLGQFPCETSSIDYVVVSPTCDAIRGYRMIGVYPASVGAVQYNQETVDSVTFDFTFRYQRWEPLNINDTFGIPNANQADAIFESYESRIAAGLNTCTDKTNIPRV